MQLSKIHLLSSARDHNGDQFQSSVLYLLQLLYLIRFNFDIYHLSSIGYKILKLKYQILRYIDVTLNVFSTCFKYLLIKIYACG